MIYCKVQDGVVVNRALFDGPPPEDWPDREDWHESDEAQIGWTFDGDDFSAPAAAPTVPISQTPQPRLCATALLTVDGDELGGVSSAAGLSFGLKMDTGLYWLFFSEEMADLSYSYAVNTSQGRATVTSRQLSYLEVTVVDDSGSPVDPAELSIQLYRAG